MHTVALSGGGSVCAAGSEHGDARRAHSCSTQRASCACAASSADHAAAAAVEEVDEEDADDVDEDAEDTYDNDDDDEGDEEDDESCWVSERARRRAAISGES